MFVNKTSSKIIVTINLIKVKLKVPPTKLELSEAANKCCGLFASWHNELERNGMPKEPTMSIHKWTTTAHWRRLSLSRVLNALRPLTAKLRWCLFSSVSHVSDRLELHNNNWASGSKYPGPSASDVYSDVIQEAQSNDLLHTARLLMCLDTPLNDNNARGTKYAVYYASVVTHTVFENKKMAALTLFWN